MDDNLHHSGGPGRALSGREIGWRHVEALQRYLDEHSRLPSVRGKVNITAIATACGFDRKVLYDNPGCRELLERAVGAGRLSGPEVRALDEDDADPEKDRLRAELSQTRELLAIERAQTHHLREALRRYRHIDAHLGLTGRLVR